MNRVKLLDRVESIGSLDSIGEGSSFSRTKTVGSKSVHTLPDFASVHESYNKALARGRHPKSIPKNSELWHFTKISNDRVSRISKGHKFWNVIDDTSVTEGSIYEHDIQDSKAQVHGVERHNAHLVTINGIQFDTKSEVDIHYGMNFVITNSADELLCIDADDKVKCKARSQVGPTDRIMYKLFDMNDATNPGVVHYGDPLWMQVWKADATEEEDFVVGSKLFESPSMNAVSLAQDKLQQQFAHVGSEQENINSSSNKSSGGGIFDMTAASAAGSIAEVENAHRISKLLARTEVQRTDKLGGGANRRNSGGIEGKIAGGAARRSSLSSSLKNKGKPRASFVAAEFDTTAAGGDGAAEGDIKTDGEEGGGGGGGIVVDAQQQEQEQQQGDGGSKAASPTAAAKEEKLQRQMSAYDEQGDSDEGEQGGVSLDRDQGGGKKKSKRRAHADVCGGVDVVRITDIKKARMAMGYYDLDSAARAEKASRYQHSKESWHLGRWCPRSALRKPPPYDVLKTRTAIYLEQDLYCLGSSQGYMQGHWPKVSADFIRMDQYADESQQPRSGEKPTNSTLSGLSAPFPLLQQQSSAKFLLSRQATKKSLLFSEDDGGGEGGGGGGVGNILAKSLQDRLAALGSGGGGAAAAGAASVGGDGASSVKSIGSNNKKSKGLAGGGGAAAAGKGSASSGAGENAAAAAGVFGCLRKVAIRGPPYEHVIDRRCVWTFCLVEDQSNMTSLNAQDLIAAKIMTKARKTLQKSELNRKGGKQFSEVTSDGRQLLGGESFPRTLRKIVGDHSFQNESTSLLSSRRREERLKQHFEEVLFGKDFMLLERDAEHRRRALEEANFSTMFMNRSKQTAALYRYQQQLQLQQQTVVPRMTSRSTSDSIVNTYRGGAGGGGNKQSLLTTSRGGTNTGSGVGTSVNTASAIATAAAPMLKSIPELASSSSLLTTTSSQYTTGGATTFLTGIGFEIGNNNSGYISPQFCSFDSCGLHTLAMKELSDVERRALARLSERKLDILVADDNTASRKEICQALQSEGHMCFEAVDGLDVVTKANTIRELGYAFDVIVMDVVMPQLDGPACAQRLRRMGYTGLIIGVTGTNYDAGINLFKQHGADEVLPKPLTLHGFHEKLFAAAAAREGALMHSTGGTLTPPSGGMGSSSFGAGNINTGGTSTPIANTARSVDSSVSVGVAGAAGGVGISRGGGGGAGGGGSDHYYDHSRPPSTAFSSSSSDSVHQLSTTAHNSYKTGTGAGTGTGTTALLRPVGIDALNKIIPQRPIEVLIEEEKKRGSGHVLPAEAPFKDCLSFGDRVLSVHQSLHHLSVKVADTVKTEQAANNNSNNKKVNKNKEDKKKVKDMDCGASVGGGGHLVLQTLMDQRLGKVKFDIGGTVQGARGPALSPRITERGGGLQLRAMGALRRDRAGSMDFDVTRIKVSNKLTRLQEEDKLIKEALEHKDKLDKFKNVSSLFDAVNSDFLPTFC